MSSIFEYSSKAQFAAFCSRLNGDGSRRCYGEIAVVEALFEAGASLDTQNAFGRCPLFRACYNGHDDMVRRQQPHAGSAGGGRDTPRAGIVTSDYWYAQKECFGHAGTTILSYASWRQSSV